jgi:hypothetical protein
MKTLKELGIRLAQFRKGCQFFECYCNESEAIAALNFVRFLD